MFIVSIDEWMHECMHVWMNEWSFFLTYQAVLQGLQMVSIQNFSLLEMIDSDL